MSPRLVIVGSVIADQMMTVPRLPERGGDVMGGPVVAQAGGLFNVIAAASRLGMPTALAGRVGTGLVGDLLWRELAATGTDVLLVRAVDGDSGCCIGFIEPDGERTFVTSPGVEQTLTDADLDTVAWRADDALYVSGYDLLYPSTGPAVARLLARLRPVTVLLDPGPLIGEIPRDVLDAVLAHTTILSLNERELGIIGEPVDAPLGIWGRLPDDATVIARVGPDGAWVHRRSEAPFRVPAFPATPVDTTGAGDAHAGALLASLADGLDLPAAVRRANAAAAIAVSRFGSAAGPTSAELAEALA